MEQKDFTYIVETEKSFDEAVVSVLKSVDEIGWSLFQIYDIKERLSAKGFEQAPLKIIEICSGKHSNNFLNKNKITLNKHSQEYKHVLTHQNIFATFWHISVNQPLNFTAINLKEINTFAVPKLIENYIKSM